MIKITDVAQKYFTELLLNQKPNTNIRISIVNPGTFNTQCELSYCSPDMVNITDIVITFHNFCMYIDTNSAIYLHDTKIDLIVNEHGSKEIVIKVPKIKISPLNDDNDLIKKVDYFLQSQVNLNLAHHGGHVILLEITKDMIAILQFSGGCNGCSMVEYTLKEGIEKELLKQFPELKGVQDATKHSHSLESFY